MKTLVMISHVSRKRYQACKHLLCSNLACMMEIFVNEGGKVFSRKKVLSWKRLRRFLDMWLPPMGTKTPKGNKCRRSVDSPPTASYPRGSTRSELIAPPWNIFLICSSRRTCSLPRSCQISKGTMRRSWRIGRLSRSRRGPTSCPFSYPVSDLLQEGGQAARCLPPDLPPMGEESS